MYWMRVGVTRPAKYERESVEIARAYGFDVFFAPLISVRRVGEPKFEEFLQGVLQKDVDFVVFMSVSSVECAFAHVYDIEPRGQLAKDFIRALNKTTVAAVGPATLRKLESCGVLTRLLPKEYSSRGLAGALRPLVRGKKVWIIRSKQGDDRLKTSLEDAGATVKEAKIYEITLPAGEEREHVVELIMLLLAGGIEVMTFTSGMCVENFLKIAEELKVRERVVRRMRSITVAALGEPTRRKLEAHGIKVDVVPKEFTFEEMIKGIKMRVQG